MNANAVKSPITKADIDLVKKHSLMFLFYARSFGNVPGVNWTELRKNIKQSIRKWTIASVMFGKRIICVSGLQGAGKTTLMKNYYDLDDSFLCPSLGRGERIPIIFTEEKDLQRPYACVVKLNDEITKASDSVTVEQRLDPKDIQNQLSGGDEDVMYVEFHVPYKYICNSQTSFMLLPGYESTPSQNLCKPPK